MPIRLSNRDFSSPSSYIGREFQLARGSRDERLGSDSHAYPDNTMVRVLRVDLSDPHYRVRVRAIGGSDLENPPAYNEFWVKSAWLQCVERFDYKDAIQKRLTDMFTNDATDSPVFAELKSILEAAGVKVNLVKPVMGSLSFEG